MMRWPSRSECPRSTRRFYAILLGWPALLAWLPRSRAAPQAAAAVACQAGAPAKVFYKRGRAPMVLVAASGSHEAGEPEQLTPSWQHIPTPCVQAARVRRALLPHTGGGQQGVCALRQVLCPFGHRACYPHQGPLLGSI